MADRSSPSNWRRVACIVLVCAVPSAVAILLIVGALWYLGRDDVSDFQSAVNLDKIGHAMYRDVRRTQRFPAQAIRGDDGKPLLSWRVALLPNLGEEALHSRFHLDEPWDSQHNVALLREMPKVYERPGVQTAGVGMTFYQVVVGAGTLFEEVDPKLGSRYDDIPSWKLLDLAMIVEANAPVPWTKPEDVSLNAEGPLPAFGPNGRKSFNVLHADGRVLQYRTHNSDSKAFQANMRRLLLRTESERVDYDAMGGANDWFF